MAVPEKKLLFVEQLLETFCILKFFLEKVVVCGTTFVSKSTHYKTDFWRGGSVQWNKPVLDAKGGYGMTQHTFAIPIRSVKEIIRYFTKERLASFKDDLNWSTSMPGTDHKLFRYIRKGFWRV